MTDNFHTRLLFQHHADNPERLIVGICAQTKAAVQAEIDRLFWIVETCGGWATFDGPVAVKGEPACFGRFVAIGELQVDPMELFT